MFTQVLFWAENKSNHQKPILFTQQTLTDFEVDEAKYFFLKKKIQMAYSK